MTIARIQQIDLESTPYYHCISRCVRRAFLCGYDRLTRKNFSHRKTWIIKRIKFLSSLFAIDICAYAIMSNHYHIVLRVDTNCAQQWQPDEIIKRWRQLFGRTAGVDHTELDMAVCPQTIELWRSRLMSISWFMRCLNENIARQANKEDKCKGRFWEGRFKCQSLLDDMGLLLCMAYVDLNPIRAGMASTPETANFTSLEERIRYYQSQRKTAKCSGKTFQPPTLLPFQNGQSNIDCSTNLLPFALDDYLHLIDWAGRSIRTTKKGHIPTIVPPILHRLEINHEYWLNAVKYLDRQFYYYIGTVDSLKTICCNIKRSWLKGITAARALCERIL